jgi:chorismate lyase / 3-hydroxybenzoate synthase
MTLAATPAATSLAIEFGVTSASATPGPVCPGLQLPVPLLAGEAIEKIFDDVQPAGERDGFMLFRRGGLLLGCALEPFLPDLATQTQRLYQRLLVLARGRHLYRIWNYVPRINAHTAGLENYQAFCRGRSLAFEETLGPAFKWALPAASAVGGDDHHLAVIFAAGATEPRHIENPEQMPAYEYPQEHGPRPPSFARATVVEEDKRRYAFISGTSAVKGHATVAPGALREQLSCTLDNLALISRAIGLGDAFGAGKSFVRHFKIYLRRAEDLAAVRDALEGALLQPHDRVTYLRADICRAALNLEIEAALVG